MVYYNFVVSSSFAEFSSFVRSDLKHHTSGTQMNTNKHKWNTNVDVKNGKISSNFKNSYQGSYVSPKRILRGIFSQQKRQGSTRSTSSFNKACDFFSTGLLRFFIVFLDNKMSLPKRRTRLFGSEREGNECFTFLVFFCCKVEIPN